ncbi:bile acid:sodium symporter [Maritimibacter sp. 55A14]|uniref:arsenic resistance protein n=1 Tax=Maritimibacter sp. 55A14 TaxID=2174844 RepID=UPI000D619A39|nr:arsenic resistance protein [Maritimibacter sp. 55A14]PWE32363.1 bile acid:sodium symporter [Maritimibacter sp. 55A14]
MTLQQFERHQVWIYLAAILLGLALGTLVPGVAGAFEMLLWPVLGLLLFATFTQVPLVHLPQAARDRRFIGAMLAGNFVLVPLLVWALYLFLPDNPAIQLGVLVVLLVPCTDWFITFTHLGRGDALRAAAATPILLFVQIALLPVFLWLFLGDTFLELLAADRVAAAFVTLILLPLAAAFVIERWAETRPGRQHVVGRLGWLPIPLLALVVFLIAASQVDAVRDALPLLAQVAGIYVAYLVAAALFGCTVGCVAGLPAPERRTLIFSFGTRNSFVVLPLVLALGPESSTAAVVIVLQSLVELLGMIAYLWIVPRYLVPEHPPIGEERVMMDKTGGRHR